MLEAYARQSTYDVYDRVAKRGLYRLVLARTLGSGECMINVQLNPDGISQSDLEEETKKLTNYILAKASEKGLNINSLYVQYSNDVFNGFKESTESILVHGTPYITEKILGLK